jgi:hypothetical protein
MLRRFSAMLIYLKRGSGMSVLQPMNCSAAAQACCFCCAQNCWSLVQCFPHYSTLLAVISHAGLLDPSASSYATHHVLIGTAGGATARCRGLVSLLAALGAQSTGVLCTAQAPVSHSFKPSALYACMLAALMHTGLGFSAADDLFQRQSKGHGHDLCSAFDASQSRTHQCTGRGCPGGSPGRRSRTGGGGGPSTSGSSGRT